MRPTAHCTRADRPYPPARAADAFVTEAMYQNLVRSAYPAAPESVHLRIGSRVSRSRKATVRDWPTWLPRGRLWRWAMRCGPRPASRCANRWAGACSGGAETKSRHRTSDRHRGRRAERQGRRVCRARARPGELQAVADNRLLGKKFGKQFPAVRAALVRLSLCRRPRAARRAITHAECGRSAVVLAPEEVLIQAQPREGFAVATGAQAEGGVVVALDTRLTPELAAEGRHARSCVTSKHCARTRL